MSKYRPGDRIISSGGAFGTVSRWINGADGGSYRVKWDSGISGLMSPSNIKAVTIAESIPRGAFWNPQEGRQMTQKHTPGPWTLSAGRTFDTTSGRFYLSYGQDKYGNARFPNFCELDANARLISAAPDLLAALTVLYNSVFSHDATRAERLDALNLASAAIRKATGE